MVRIPTVVVAALVASATATHNDEVNPQHHLRKPIGAGASSTTKHFLGDGGLKSFLLWPYEQMVNTNVNVDDEKYHPLGSHYPRPTSSSLDTVDPNNVLFSLTINSKKSNIMRRRRRRRLQLSSERELRHEPGHEGTPKYTLDISAALEAVPIFVDKRDEPLPGALLAKGEEEYTEKDGDTTQEEMALQHVENDAHHDGSESGHIPDGTHWEEEELGVYVGCLGGCTSSAGSKAHSDAHSEEENEAHSDAHSEEENEAHSDAHDMVVHVTYENIYAILVFLVVATAMGIFTSKLGMPALVGEIITGFLLGPPLADFVPYPEALVLVGEIGLIMLLLEAGVELDVAQLRETGTRAFAIGFTGTILPLLVGIGLAMASGSDVGIKTALAVGASFSPTSLGVAASALKTGKMLDTPVGQLIVASCVVDDILALILLSMFQVLVEDSPSIYQYFIPIISSVGFLILLGGSAVTWLPKFIQNKILNKVPECHRELVMFSIMTAMLLAYLPMLNYTKASYLTGAFLAGCTFSQIDSAHHAFMEKTHQLMTWLLRVFFAASIGFQVPVKLFGDPYVMGWGFILYVCVLAKLPLAVYVPQFEDIKEGASYNPFLRDRLISGLAMTCRGEFSFIIAAFALGEGLFNAQIYAAIVWAVLLSCITSPFILLQVINYFNKKQMNYLASTNPVKRKGGGDENVPLYLHIKCKAPNSWGQQEIFRKTLNDLNLEIVDRRTNRHGRGLDSEVQTDLYVRDTTMNIKLQKIGAQRRIKRALQTAMELTEEEAKSLAAAADELTRLMTDDSNFFSKFDTNNDGVVSLAELKVGLENSLQMTLSLRQARKIMELFDKDSDGLLQTNELVTIEEFKNRMNQILMKNKTNARKNEKQILRMSATRRMSSSELSYLSLQSLAQAEQDALKEDSKEQDNIIERGGYIEMRVEEALGGDSEVIVDVWNPWPWTELLDKIASHYELEKTAHFLSVFDEIDIDKGGTIDKDEMYDALKAAGVNISEEGVLTLCNMIDEDGDGEIDRDEWRDTVEFYLELKKEEAEMTKDQVDHAGLQKNLRAKKLMELGLSARALTQSEGRKKRRLSFKMPNIKSISRRENVADTGTTTVAGTGRRSLSMADLGTRSPSSMRWSEANAQWAEVHAPREDRESPTSSSSDDPITF